MKNAQKNTQFFLPALLFATMASTANIARAQDSAEEQDSGRGMEEVIVTVERREVNLQDLAGTALSFGGDALKMQGVQNLTDLSESAPGVEISTKQGNVEVWIRGIGSSNNTELGDPAAATHLDGVYIPRPTGVGSMFFDIGRVEVNIGPQGTLRGRNATAGSVNIIPWRPGLGEWDVAVEGEIGNYDLYMFNGMVNAPIGDNAAFRIAGQVLDNESYYNDVGPLEIGVAEAQDNKGVRAQFYWEPTEDLRMLFAYDRAEEQGTGYTGSNFASPLGNGVDPDSIDDPRDVIARAFEPIQDTVHWGTKFQLNYDFGWADLEYSYSYRDLIYDFQFATPLTPDYPGVLDTFAILPQALDDWSRVQFITDSESTIHELRLISPSDNRLFYTLGAFLFEEDQFAFLASTGDRGGFFQGSEFNQPDTQADSWSLYGDFTFNVTDTTRITGGLRYTDDEKSRVGVNARYAFALGGFDVLTGNQFACCSLGARVGTEGFRFAGQGRTIYDPDTDGSGDVSSQEFLDFYFDGIASFGTRDTVPDIFPNGQLPDPNNLPECTDPDLTDTTICNQNGLYSFVDVINPDNSITPQNGALQDDFIDWRIRLEHDVSDTSLAYALVATGHKSGGFNDTFKDPTIGISLAPTYDTEKVTYYELGWKNEFDWGDVPTRLNGSAFYYDYSNQVFTSLLSVEQAVDFNTGGVTEIDQSDTDPSALVVSFSFNAADSEIYGIQLDGQFEFENNVNLKWTALWLEAEIKDAEDIQDSRFQADVAPDDAVFRSIDGKRLPFTPRYQLNASLSQFIEVPTGSVDYVFSAGWRDSQFLTIYNSEDYAQPDNPRGRLNDRVGSYWSFDAGVGYTHGEEGKLRVEAYANNILNDVHTAAIIITQFDNTRFFSRPRTYGLRVKYNF